MSPYLYIGIIYKMQCVKKLSCLSCNKNKGCYGLYRAQLQDDIATITLCYDCLKDEWGDGFSTSEYCKACLIFANTIDDMYSDKRKTCKNLKEANRKLKKELDELKAHLKYMPDGPGFIEAKESFENKIEK